MSTPIQIPSIGRVVHYRLSEHDAQAINRRRTTGGSIRERMQQEPPAWPEGAQAHIGTTVAEGGVFPMLITRVELSNPAGMVSGQVFLDGNDVLWADCVELGDGAGSYAWPPRT